MKENSTNPAYYFKLYPVALLIIFACCFVSYMPSVQHRYFQFDDYNMFHPDTQKTEILKATLGQARPLTGFLTAAVKDRLETPENSAVLRLFNIFFYALTGFLLWIFLRYLQSPLVLCYILPIGMLLLHPLSHIIPQTVAFPYGLSALLSVQSAVLLLKDGASGLLKKNSARALLSALLLFLSLSVYQLTAMYCFIPVALYIMFGPSAQLKKILRVALVFAGTLLFYFLFYKIINVLLNNDTARSELVSSPEMAWNKVKWFFAEPVKYSIEYASPFKTAAPYNNISLFKYLALALFILSFPLFFLVLRRKYSLRIAILLTVILFLLLPLSILPNLVLKESWAYPFYLSVLSGLIFAYIYIPVLTVIDWFRKGETIRKFYYFFLCLVLFNFSYAASRYTLYLYALPNLVTYNYLKSLLKSTDLKQLKRIHVSGTAIQIVDEFKASAIVSMIAREIDPAAAVNIKFTSALKSGVPDRINLTILEKSVLALIVEPKDREFVSHAYEKDQLYHVSRLKQDISAEDRKRMEKILSEIEFIPPKRPDVLEIRLNELTLEYASPYKW